MTMLKKFLIPVLLLSLIQGCASIHDQFFADATGSKKFPPSREVKVGVLTFNAPAPGVSKYATVGEGTYTTPANTGVSVADAISPELMRVPNVILVERSQLEKIISEHKLSLSGMINNPDFAILRQLLPVDALLIGNVTNFTYWHETSSWGASVAYSGRLVDIQTGEVLFTINCSASRFNGSADRMAQELAREAIRKAIEK